MDTDSIKTCTLPAVIRMKKREEKEKAQTNRELLECTVSQFEEGSQNCENASQVAAGKQVHKNNRKVRWC